jgi:hypothetical protein
VDGIEFPTSQGIVYPQDNLFARNLTTGATEILTGLTGFSSAKEIALSADGRIASFSSDSSIFVPNDTNGSARDVFVTPTWISDPAISSYAWDQWRITAGPDGAARLRVQRSGNSSRRESIRYGPLISTSGTDVDVQSSTSGEVVFLPGVRVRELPLIFEIEAEPRDVLMAIFQPLDASGQARLGSPRVARISLPGEQRSDLALYLDQYYTPAQLEDPALTALSSDRDRDGLTLLEEFLFGGHPEIVDTGLDARATRLWLADGSIGERAYLALEIPYERPEAPVEVTVEASANLLAWTPISEDELVVFDEVSAPGRRMLVDTISGTADAPDRRFLRLKLRYTGPALGAD